jgi:hypothetical protein
MIQALSLILFLTLCIGGCLSPAWALALLFLHFALEQVLQAAFPSIFVANMWLVNVITGMVVVIAVARVVFSGSCYGRAYFSPIWKGTLIIYVWSVVSLLWTPSSNSAWRFISEGLPYVALFLIAAPILIVNIANVRRFALIYLVAGTSIATLVELSPGITTQTGRLGLHFGGKSYSNPLELGGVGGALVIGAALLGSSTHRKLFLGFRIVGFLVGALMCAESGSRGQLIFAIAMAVVFFPIAQSVRSITNFVLASVGAVALALVAITFAVWVLPDNVSARWTAGQIEGGFIDRIFRVGDLAAYSIVRPHLWPIGVGFNAFDAVSLNQTDYSHVLILDILFESGVVIFGLYLWMIFRTVKSGYTLLQRHVGDPASRSTVAFLLAICLFEFFLSNKQGQLWSSWNLFLFMEVVVFLEIQGQQDGDRNLQVTHSHQEFSA